jgi:hypothetical protein
MSWQNLSILKVGAVLAATFLLLAPEVLAGDRVHAGNRTAVPSRSAASPGVAAVPLLGTFAVTVATLPQPTKEAVFVDIRGADGQVRRFPVEGGRAAIQYREGFLRPGQMLTIRWTPTK